MSKPSESVSLQTMMDYPPLYSMQVPENKDAQYKVWTDLIVATAKAKKVWSISLQEFPIFRSAKLNQGEASMELRVEIIEFMVRNGWAFWIGSSQKSQAYVLTKSLSNWGNTIFNYLNENGMTDVMLANELTTGIEYSDEPWFEMPDALMEQLLEHLVKEGRMTKIRTPEANGYKIKL